MRKHVGILAGVLALAGLGATGQVAHATAKTIAAQESYKATPQKKERSKTTINEVTGGLDFPRFNDYGMSPKEYGMRFGTGKSRNKRSNRNRYAHNAKLSRRINKANH